MTTTAVYALHSSHSTVEPGSLQLGLEGALGSAYNAGQVMIREKKGSWKEESALSNARISAILDKNVLASDVVMLDKAGPPADRGPSIVEAQKLMKTWQYQVSGKLSVAAALTELPVDHIKHGGPVGVQAEACKHIQQLGLEDTFYVVDLGNVQRMYKALPARASTPCHA
ncbi:hypothetical protein CEUSTIGMA_g1226.t1 [Chlamydomonas eustigma]|uniref:Uncharacterized protein n=1 Tax=Chlamydomonas eustigma TaxID=1157962 RepID=A0A250WSF8_9CHLO|nr:hypothetical protein CEUSTIGMA_g1226.t1 [Chlamydomonas eustigma]|eukprot:GAX73775.1 hypothetical protein CEUSTIGMA_g1226.t1 [Chlamydomonas eustigma]